MNAVLIISERDNVATALEPIDPGRELRAGAWTVVAVEAIPRGHKVAVCAIRAGEAVVKYGNPIGTASADIAAGSHVHTHNLADRKSVV